VLDNSFETTHAGRTTVTTRFADAYASFSAWSDHRGLAPFTESEFEDWLRGALGKKLYDDRRARRDYEEYRAGRKRDGLPAVSFDEYRDGLIEWLGNWCFRTDPVTGELIIRGLSLQSRGSSEGSTAVLSFG
jgi:hypothetical protein